MHLWIRCPLRSKNYREALLGTHTERLPNGNWVLKWRGDLKVKWRNGKLNQYRYVIDEPELIQLWEEWLHVWRPLLVTPDERHVFVNSLGLPFTEQSIGRAIRSATWRFTGKAMNPHMIRDCYASDMLAHGASIHDVARALNDTMQVVYDKYAHITQRDADERTAAKFRDCLA
jgi:site-specific recombinase XerD